jgi:hypothetical protein
MLHWRNDAVEIWVRRERTLPAADPKGIDILHALGAMLENIVLTLNQLGYVAEYEVSERLRWDVPVIVVRWHPSTSPPPDPTLYRMIPIRRTSRLPYAQEPISTEVLKALQSTVGFPCSLYTLTQPDDIAEVRALVAEATSELMADTTVANEVYSWLRFFPRDPRWYRDGLTAACMGWKRWEAALAGVVLLPPVLRLLTRFGLHRAVFANMDQQAPQTPVLCLLTVKEEGVGPRIEAGRCLQRIWLAAASNGLATHPLSAAVDLERTRRRAMKLFNVPPGERHVNLFRLGRSAPSARSPRLPADEILHQ